MPRLLATFIPDLLAEAEAERAAIAAGLPCGPVTGFTSLDAALGGYLVPGLHIVHAEPGAGKSAICLQIGCQCRYPILYVTAEMSPVELLRRCAARTTGTNLNRLNGKQLTADALTAILDATSEANPMCAFLDATAGDVLPAAIAMAADGLMARFQARRVLIVIDSLTDWAAGMIGRFAANEYEANEEALTALKGIALKLVCPVLIIVHRNRASQSAGADRQMFSGKGTGRIEYIAESLWVLAPNGKADPTGKRSVSLTLAKNRHGAAHDPVMFQFEGRVQKFVEV
jgi:replicative DNA helicase